MQAKIIHMEFFFRIVIMRQLEELAAILIYIT